MIPKTKNKKKRIGIDARLYGPIGKGLGRYTQEIVDNILRIDRENEYVIFLSRANFDEFNFQEERVKKVMADARWYTLKEQILMPFLIAKERLDLIHFPHFNVPVLTPTKFVVTIHDLILTKFPTVRASTLEPLVYKFKNLAYKTVIRGAVKRAKKIIAVSEFTKKDIVTQFGVSPRKIAVTYEGVANLAKGRDSLFVSKLDDTETLLSYNIKKDFFLYVGNAYPHKNLEGLVEAFAEFYSRNPEVNLVLVGKEDYFYARLKEFVKSFFPELPVIFPGYVPDNKLEVLYQRALAYVFPSLYEGFGLPSLEAMAKGCPVVSSKRSSMPEILGEAAIYFNPEDKTDIAARLEEIKKDPDLREKLINRGKKRVRQFSWWKCARQTWEIYNYHV